MRRRWRAGLVAVILMIAVVLGAPQASSAGGAGLTAMPANTRAMWLWGDTPAAEVVTWAATHGVTEIFTYVSPSALTNGDLARLRVMKQRADAARIKLRALGGDSSWTTDSAAALDWLRTVLATGLFEGIHLDVEPYLTAGWEDDRETTERAYLRLLDAMRSGSTLSIEADVPFWYGELRVGAANFADEVLKRVGAVTVMSYRDTAAGPNAMLAVSQDWLVRGAAAGKRVRLGAETGPLTDCGYCTFYQEGAAAMNRELAKVDAGTRKSAAFGGIAIHRYGSWRTLRP
jgi:hypothetical protein